MIRLTSLLLIASTLPAAAQSGNAVSSSGPLSFGARYDSLAALTAEANRPGRPVLKGAVSVVGDIVRIRDLVEHAGTASDIAVFRAPDLGQTGRVGVARILDALTRHAVVDVDTRGFTEVVVTRSSKLITPQDFEERVSRLLASRQRAADIGNFTLTLDSEASNVHLEPDAEPRVARMSYDPRSGRFDITFELPGPGRRVQRITGLFAETFEAAVLIRPIPAGTALKASDLKLMRRPKSEYAANIVTDPEQAAGLASRQPLRPGHLLRQTDLTKPEVIARNESVTITYEVPGIVLSMRGKAVEAGAQGDVISVLNVQSKRTIQATVAGPGHVILSAPGRARVVLTPPPPPARVAAETRQTVHPHAHVRAQ
jgi:flagella basal body P-ring formation protein FlgA